MQSTGMMVFWFVVVVALIPLTLMVLKRSGLGQGVGSGGSGEKVLKTISQLSIGPAQRVVTVELGAGEQKTWLVLGVTAQHISVLHTLQPTEDSQVQAHGDPASSSFPVLLRRSSDMVDLPKA